MLKLLFRVGFPSLAKLLQKSIKNPKTLAIVMVLVHIVEQIIGGVSDDDEDNTSDIDKIIAKNLPNLSSILNQ